MKYLIALVAGVAAGAGLFLIGLAYNPMMSKSGMSPLASSDAPTLSLAYPAVATDSLMYTNSGDDRTRPYPERIKQLWEAPISQTEAAAMILRDRQDDVAGIGVKISSAAESTRLFEGKALRNSVWYVYLPGRGTLFVEQTENYWDYLRDIVLPAYRSSSGTWKGVWTGVITHGPTESGLARVVGGSGDFAGVETFGVESLSVQTWRDTSGPLAAEGQLTIELPGSYAAAD